MFPLLDMVRWSLDRAAKGQYDVCRHDGSNFEFPGDQRLYG
jgi:hypothetical protein